MTPHLLLLQQPPPDGWVESRPLLRREAPDRGADQVADENDVPGGVVAAAVVVVAVVVGGGERVSECTCIFYVYKCIQHVFYM